MSAIEQPLHNFVDLSPVSCFFKEFCKLTFSFVSQVFSYMMLLLLRRYGWELVIVDLGPACKWSEKKRSE